MPKSKKEIDALIERMDQGIHVDLGGGQYPQGKDWVNIDMRDLPQVDIVHNLCVFPWPLPDECASIVLASHIIEHINPMPSDPRLVGLVDLLLKKKLLTTAEVRQTIGVCDGKPLFLSFMDEIWRILKPGGKLMITTPYAGSFGYFQDPTHINPCNEATFAYFDPMIPLDRNQPSLGGLWNIYEPKPFAVEINTWHANGNLECVMRKRPIQKKYLYPDNSVPAFAAPRSPQPHD